MQNLILVRGLPGSGKSTFAWAYAEQSRRNVMVLAADDYFETDDGYHFDGSKISQAHKACQERTRHGLGSGYDVIVANTFTTAKEFKPYKAMVKSTYRLRVFNLFDGGLTDSELAQRNVHGVPEATIAKMRDRWTPAPVEEVHVHVNGTYAYWQFPESGYLELVKGDNNGAS